VFEAQSICSAFTMETCFGQDLLFSQVIKAVDFEIDAARILQQAH
jgi:hypothetical protein